MNYNIVSHLSQQKNVFEDLLKYLPEREQRNIRFKKQIRLYNMIYQSEIQHNMQVYIEDMNNEIIDLLKTMMIFVNENIQIPDLLLNKYKYIMDRKKQEEDGYCFHYF